MQRWFMIYLLFLFLCPSIYGAEVAITIDDFNFEQNEYLEGSKRDELIRQALKKHNIKAMGFVTTKFLSNEKAKKALDDWEKEEHLLGNHTESHFNYHKTSFNEFKKDVLIADRKLSSLKNYRKRFRFPYLKEGDTQMKRDQMRSFLKKEGFQSGAVTIDASDWYVNQRLLKASNQKRESDLNRYRNFYLAHIWERSLYYAKLAKENLGKEVRFTLLLHHNVTTALFLDDLLQMYKEKGWKLIDAEKAFIDPIYKKEVDNLPAGESLIWAIAKERGDKNLRYPAESDIYEKEKMDQLDL